MDREAIERSGDFSIDPPSYRGSIEIVIRNSLRARQISQVSKRCRGAVEIA